MGSCAGPQPRWIALNTTDSQYDYTAAVFKIKLSYWVTASALCDLGCLGCEQRHMDRMQFRLCIEDGAVSFPLVKAVSGRISEWLEDEQFVWTYAASMELR